jgi:hypothetical protein
VLEPGNDVRNRKNGQKVTFSEVTFSDIIHHFSLNNDGKKSSILV